MAPKNRLEDLRNHLFDTIERLKDDQNPMDIERAKAVAQVAGVILDSAKVEIGYMRVTDGLVESDFIAPNPERPRLPAHPAPSSVPERRTEPPLPTPSAKMQVQCLDCGEKFPDAKALGIHKSRVHFSDRSLSGSTLGQA